MFVPCLSVSVRERVAYVLVFHMRGHAFILPMCWSLICVGIVFIWNFRRVGGLGFGVCVVMTKCGLRWFLRVCATEHRCEGCSVLAEYLGNFLTLGICLSSVRYGYGRLGCHLFSAKWIAL